MYLMCKDVPVLQFDLEDYVFEVMNETLLPYNMKDYMRSSSECATPQDVAKFCGLIKTFFADRTLSMSRSNAKQILMAASLPQKLTDEDRCKIALKCRGVSVTDSYWVKDEGEQVTFQDVNIRNRSLSDIVFHVSIMGKNLSLQLKDIEADVMTQGMYAKTWLRRNGELYLAKTDKLKEHNNVNAEVVVSDCLNNSNVNHVLYKKEIIEGRTMALCKCMTSDDISLVDAEYIRQWCSHTKRDFLKFIASHFREDFAKMVVSDYIFANTDRHINNWGFLVNSNTNQILSMAPLYDHNQALIADEFDANIDELVYEATNKNFLESAREWYLSSNLYIEKSSLPKKVANRLDGLEKFIQKEYFNKLSFWEERRKDAIQRNDYEEITRLCDKMNECKKHFHPYSMSKDRLDVMER